MPAHSCNSIIFLSSAAFYGEPPLGLINVCGRKKYFIEEIIHDQGKAGKGRKGILLRYFNPVGAHLSGKIVEKTQAASQII